MADKTYAELLRDPRWQRKRLEIMQRDGFACRNCADETKNLQVHHKRYVRGRMPWEYGADVLVTLCEDCHTKEGFRVVRIEEFDVYFRVNDGILVRDDENNGARCWFEPDKSKPNASVSRSVLDCDHGRTEFEFYERRALVKEAVQRLLDNLKAGG